MALFSAVLMVGGGSCSANDELLADTGSAIDAASTVDAAQSDDALDTPAVGVLVAPTSIDFDPVTVGAFDTRTVVVVNASPDPVTVASATLYGPSTLALLDDQTGGAPAFPVDLEPGESRAWLLRFSPTTPGVLVATLTFETSAGLHTVSITGEGVPPVLPEPCRISAPKTVQFGTVLVGQGGSQTVTLTGCPGESVVITGLTIEGAEYGFALDVSTGAPLQLDPGDEATIMVNYTPNSETATATGRLLVSIEGRESPEVVVLHASAAGAPITTPEECAALSPTGCPVALGFIAEGAVVAPLTTLHLYSNGSCSPTGGVAKRQWTVTQPSGSVSTFTPSSNFPNPTFQVIVVGVYHFRLEVQDETGVASCAPWEGTVTVAPVAALYVELTWTTPSDTDESNEGSEAGSDLDLHFAHLKFAVRVAGQQMALCDQAYGEPVSARRPRCRRALNGWSDRRHTRRRGCRRARRWRGCRP